MGENKKEVKARKKAFRKTQSDTSMERIINCMCNSGSDLCATVQFIKCF